MRSNRTLARSLVVGALGALVIAAPACSSKDEGAKASDSTKAPATTTTAATTDSTEAASPSDGTVQVTAIDYKFEGIPAKVKPGTKFTLVNKSAAELHEMVVVRLNDDEKRPVSELVKLPEDDTSQAGEEMPTFVSLAMPNSNEQIQALGDGTVTKPGRYAVICSIPTGASPQAYMEAAQNSGDGPPQVEGGPPHLANGMFAEFTVS